MDFDQLTTFVEVAKQRNFSRAAETVLRSQPAVSAQIHQLEEEYGEKLFDRTRGAIRLTPAGEVLFEYAERLLALRSESRRAVADSGQITRGLLSIGANETTFLYVLPDILAEYRKRFPRVRISIYRNFSQKVLEKVESGAIELGVVSLPIKVPSLKVIKLFRDPIVWIAPPDHPLAGRKTVTAADLAEEDLIFHRIGSLRRLMDEQLRPHRAQVRVAMELTSAAIVKKFVASGFGISLISASFAEEEIRAGKLKTLPVEGTRLYRELGLVYQRERSLCRAATSFIEVAKRQTSRPESASAAS
jgi:DNA-binding transcriptional LysR family regulator